MNRKDFEWNVLLFGTTIKDVEDTVKIINTKFENNNIIALPLHSNVNEKINDMINWSKNLTNEIKKITIDKKYFLEYLNEPNKQYKKVEENTYKNAIIVATNIAEASITINPLKYVIDTGYYNNVNFDELTKMKTSTLKEIAENNRIQRRGRVGRINNGIVYYVYKKNSKLKNRKNYAICNENMSSVYLQLIFFMKNYNIEKIIKIIKHYHYNWEKKFKKLFNNEIFENDDKLFCDFFEYNIINSLHCTYYNKFKKHPCEFWKMNLNTDVYNNNFNNIELLILN